MLSRFCPSPRFHASKFPCLKMSRRLLAVGGASLLGLGLAGCGGSSSSGLSGSTSATTLAAHYTFTNLGSVGTGGTLPTGINNAGVITGVFSSNGGAAIQSFRHTGASPATLSDVLTLPASVLRTNGSVQAGSINSVGTVAGTFDFNYSNTGTVAALQDAFVYDSAFHDLGALPPPSSVTGRSIAVAAAVNDSGTVVGSDNFEDQDQTRAFRHTGTGPLTAADDLGTVAGYAHLTPTAINNAGTIAGTARAGGNTAVPVAQHTFVYDTSFHDLGTLPGTTSSSAVGINASGIVIGFCGSGSGFVSFRHSGTGPLTAADSLGAGFVANGINADGDVVGLVNVTASIVKVGGTVQSLAPLVTNLPAGFGLQNATAINDAGQIVGYTRNNGIAEAWLLTPAP